MYTNTSRGAWGAVPSIPVTLGHVFVSVIVETEVSVTVDLAASAPKRLAEISTPTTIIAEAMARWPRGGRPPNANQGKIDLQSLILCRHDEGRNL
jgi:hypothetical protein